MTTLDDQRDNMQEGAHPALANAAMRLRGALVLVEGPAQPHEDTDTAGEDDLEAVPAGAANMTSYCEVCDGTFHRNRAIWYSSPHSYRSQTIAWLAQSTARHRTAPPCFRKRPTPSSRPAQPSIAEQVVVAALGGDGRAKP